jgi:hypothetical protein
MPAAAAAKVVGGNEASGLQRSVWFFAGTVMPFLCFFVSSGSMGPAHSLNQIAGSLLYFGGWLPLLPLLLICMGSIVALAVEPDYLASNGWVRLGVCSGVVLSLEYWLIFQIALSGNNSWWSMPASIVWGAMWSVAAVVIAWGLARTVASAINMARDGSYGCALAILLPFACFIICFVPYSVMAIAVLCLLCAIPWAVAAYVSAAVWLFRRRHGKALQFTLWQLLAAMTWLAIHFAAWRTAILMVLGRLK